MAPKTPADLLSLSDAALTDLGFDPALLKAWTLATLSIPDVQALSPATLTALKIGPLKTLTTENLKAITDAGDAKKILDAVNGLLLTNRTDFPFDQITLAQLESLDNASLTALGFDGTKLKALDPTALKLTDLLSLSDAALQISRHPGAAGRHAVRPQSGHGRDGHHRAQYRHCARHPPNHDRRRFWQTDACQPARSERSCDLWLRPTFGSDSESHQPQQTSAAESCGPADAARVRTGIAGLNTAAPITPAKINALNAANKAKFATALGIATLADLKPEHLAALNLTLLMSLLPASLTQAGFAVPSEVAALTLAQVQAVTLAEWQALPESALRKIGAQILKQVETPPAPEIFVPPRRVDIDRRRGRLPPHF